MEDEVDEKYYISDDKVQRFLTNLNTKLYDPCQVKREGKSREYNDYCPTLTSRDYKDPRLVNENVVKQVGNISDCNGNWKNPQVGRIYDPDGCSPTLNTCGGGSHEPKIVCGIDKSVDDTKQIEYANCITAREDRGISNRKSEGTDVLETPDYSYCLDANYYKGTTIEQYVDKHRRQLIAIPQATKKGYIECEIGGVADLSYPNSKTRRGRVQDGGNICPTITATETGICRLESLLRIRKLTPKECFRLMGFSDSAYDAASKVVSNSQLYKQSGNSIVVDVLYYILIELYKAMPYLFDDLKLSSFFSGIGAFEVALDRLYESINTGNFTKPQVE